MYYLSGFSHSDIAVEQFSRLKSQFPCFLVPLLSEASACVRTIRSFWSTLNKWVQVVPSSSSAISEQLFSKILSFSSSSEDSSSCNPDLFKDQLTFAHSSS